MSPLVALPDTIREQLQPAVDALRAEIAEGVRETWQPRIMRGAQVAMRTNTGAGYRQGTRTILTEVFGPGVAAATLGNVDSSSREYDCESCEDPDCSGACSSCSDDECEHCYPQCEYAQSCCGYCRECDTHHDIDEPESTFAVSINRNHYYVCRDCEHCCDE